MKAQLTRGAAVLSATAAMGLLHALPASAYTINDVDKSITFTLGDALPEMFTVEFDGNVNNTDVPGLASKANVSLTNFTSNSATFVFDLFSTPSGDITSARVRALGFDVDVALSGASVSGDFTDTDRPGNFPNGQGNRDVCFYEGGNCTGGPNGATPGNPINFTTTLNFASALNTGDTFELSNWVVRYQSIDGTTLGTSGTGEGTPIPTPALLPGLVGMGIAALRKRQGDAEVTADA